MARNLVCQILFFVSFLVAVLDESLAVEDKVSTECGEKDAVPIWVLLCD